MTVSKIKPHPHATKQSTPAIVPSIGDSLLDRSESGAKLARELFDVDTPTLRRAPEGGRMVVVSAHLGLDKVMRLAQHYEAMGKPLVAAHLYAAAALSEFHSLADVATAVGRCERHFDLLPDAVKIALRAQIEALRQYDVALDATPELDEKLKALGKPGLAEVRRASYRVAAQKISDALVAANPVRELGQIHLCARLEKHPEVMLLASAGLQVRGRELGKEADVSAFLTRTGAEVSNATHDELMQALATLRGASTRPVVKAPETKGPMSVAKPDSTTVAAVRGQRPADKEAALRDACKIGDLAAVKLLISDTAVNINEMGPGRRTALWWACANGHVNVAKALLAAGATRDAKTSRGQSPFWIACANGHLEVAQALHSAGVAVRGDKDARGVSPLQAAYDKRRANVAKWFFDLGIEKD
jgi:hypothetical protein